MRGMMNAACLAGVLSTIAVSELVAQSQIGVGVGAKSASPTQSVSRLSVKRAARGVKAPFVQDAGSPTTFTILGGIATGDDPFDLGFAIAGTATFHPAGMPIGVRVDPYLARHGGGDYGDAADLSLLLFGVAGNVEWTIPMANAFTAQGGGSSFAPYIFGGLGIYRSEWDFDTVGPFDLDGGGTDVGFGFGGGARFGGQFGVEIRLNVIDDFTTLPILASWRF